MIVQEKIAIKTGGHRDLHDLTDAVRRIVAGSGIRIGIAHIFCVGSTAAIGTIEFEPGLQRDLPDMLNRLIPASKSYGHEQTWNDGNGHSHLQATLLGPDISVPVNAGSPILGTWQQIFFLNATFGHASARSW
jgi:secondary thiamine-phosphate synthase enzyme